jgi:hypothetical protein
MVSHCGMEYEGAPASFEVSAPRPIRLPGVLQTRGPNCVQRLLGRLPSADGHCPILASTRDEEARGDRSYSKQADTQGANRVLLSEVIG